MGLREYFDSFETNAEFRGDFTVIWSKKGTGFGQFHFYEGKDGKMHCDNETMGRPFIKGILAAMVDKCAMDDPHPNEPSDDASSPNQPESQQQSNDQKE